MLTSCDSRLDARNAKKSYVHVRWAWPCTKNKTLVRYANEKDNLCVDILQFPSPHLITDMHRLPSHIMAILSQGLALASHAHIQD